MVIETLFTVGSSPTHLLQPHNCTSTRGHTASPHLIPHSMGNEMSCSGRDESASAHRPSRRESADNGKQLLLLHGFVARASDRMHVDLESMNARVARMEEQIEAERAARIRAEDEAAALRKAQEAAQEAEEEREREGEADDGDGVGEEAREEYDIYTQSGGAAMDDAIPQMHNPLHQRNVSIDNFFTAEDSQQRQSQENDFATRLAHQEEQEASIKKSAGGGMGGLGGGRGARVGRREGRYRSSSHLRARSNQRDSAD